MDISLTFLSIVNWSVIGIGGSKDKRCLYSTQDGVTLQPYLPDNNTWPQILALGKHHAVSQIQAEIVHISWSM